ncbi:MAG: methionyl-tRNA formyltransferase [Spirochaetaceae bacterium]|nr:methionyl-tRNA formyltransferase [Spirochaetaceae bacterium]
MPPAPPRLRLVFFGTPEIAVPTLERLIAGPHAVVGVVSQPDRPRGRGRKLSPSPVAEVALREGLPLLRPEKVGEPSCIEALRALEPDLGVVVAFGQFLPKKIRELPTRGYLINAHASLLPKLRGAAPIARAIAEGESETGISVMRIEKEMDAGPTALVLRTPIGPQEDAAELTTRLGALAADAIAQAVDAIARDEIVWTEQDASRATFAAKIDKADAVLDLREPASRLACRIHAVSPKPGATLTLLPGGGSEGVDLKVSRATTRAFAPGERPEVGRIERVDPSVAGDGEGPLRIATGDGWLVPLVLQRPGGRPLPVADFLRGFEIAAGARMAVVAAAAATDEGDGAAPRAGAGVEGAMSTGKSAGATGRGAR